MDDIFKPRQEPARSIYQAFQLEAGKRRGRSIEEWIAAEEDAVLREGVIQAVSHGLNLQLWKMLYKPDVMRLGPLTMARNGRIASWRPCVGRKSNRLTKETANVASPKGDQIRIILNETHLSY